MTIDVSALLDRPQLGSFRRHVVLMCFMISVVDGFDVQAMAFVAPVLSTSWGVTRVVMGQLLTAGLVGLLIGNVVLGRLSDRVGRRPVLLGSVVWFGLASFATTYCNSVAQLMLARLLTGIGLGGAVVAALALTAEYAPARSRALLVTSMFVGFPLGGSIGGLVAAPVISAYGWQGVFGLGALLPLVLVSVIWRWLPESLQFRVASRSSAERIGALVRRLDPTYRQSPDDQFVLREPESRNSSPAELFVRKRLSGTALLWLICFANLLVLYLLVNWLPSILHQSGMTLARANLGAVAFNMGGVFGGLLLSRTVDRVGAFVVLSIAYGLTAFVILTLSKTASAPLAFSLTFLAGGGVIGSQFCINALAAGFYPTAVRATGVGWALGFGRLGSIAGPLIGGFALASGATMATIFAGAAIPVMVCAVAVTFLAAVYRRGTGP